MSLFDLPLLSLKPFITLLALANPLACLPFFIHYTSGSLPEQRLKTIQTVAITVSLVFTSCALLGLQILQFFNISLAGFQVGGGMLLLLSALQMLNAQPVEAKTTAAEQDYAARHTSIGVVPLAIPLLTGPAAMSTMVIFADRTRNWLQMTQLIFYGLLVAGTIYITFMAAPRVARALGQTGINIMTRLMGLILAALSVEVMAEGLKKLFPILASAAVV